jgi:multiple sugar transport system substrate-binding protein
MYRSRSGAMQHRVAAGAAVTLAMVLTACSNSASSAGGGGSTAVRALHVMDYYDYEPDKSIYAKTLADCGRANGVTIVRDVVPGASYIAKVLQEGSSRTLPDVLMLDNPDLQQIAATGALTPLTDYGLSAAGYVEGVVAASTYQGKLYGLQPVTNTIALFYNKDLLARAGVTPPTTWAELQTTAKKLTAGKQYGIAFAAQPASRAPGRSPRSCGPTAVTRRTSPPRRPPQPSSNGWTWCTVVLRPSPS